MAQNVSQRFLDACRESDGYITVADLYYNRNLANPVVRGLPVIGGSISIDNTSATRRSGTITLAYTDLISPLDTATLQPYGLEIGIRCGVQFPDGTTEFVNMGIYPISDLAFAEEEGNIPTATVEDRSAFLSEQFSSTGVEDYSGKSTYFAIQDLLTKSIFINVNQVSGKQDPLSIAADQLALVVDFANLNDITIPSATPMNGGSFWDDIQSLALSLGAEIFFAPDGVNVILQRIPDITQDVTPADAVRVINPGEYGNLVTAARTVSRNGAYNAVQATGSLPANAASTAVPPSVFVYDSDPSSATFYDTTGGTNTGFGRVVYVMTSDTITTQPQLLAAATAQLKKFIGLARTLSFTMLPDPSLDAGDIIQVFFTDGTYEMAMITQIAYDLGGGPMQVTTSQPNQIGVIIAGDGSITPPDGGSNPPPAPTGSTTKTYNATYSRSYQSNNAEHDGGAPLDVYQGDDNLGATNRKGLIGFDYAQIIADLAGHTITGCQVYLKYYHWWYVAGGTAIIGTHNTTGTTAPTTYVPANVTANRVHSSGWGRGVARKVDLGVTIGQEFQNGVSTGIALGPGPTSDRTYYGYAAGAQTSGPCQLIITYIN